VADAIGVARSAVQLWLGRLICTGRGYAPLLEPLPLRRIIKVFFALRLDDPNFRIGALDDEARPNQLASWYELAGGETPFWNNH
jgi:hypothetical protein